MGIDIKNIFGSKKNVESFENQNEDKFVLKSYKKQVIDYLYSGENIYYKKIAFEILEKLSEEDIVEILDYLFKYNKPVYDMLIQGFENLEFKNDTLNSTYYAFQLKMYDDFEKEYQNIIDISSNTGYLITFLLSKYYKYTNKKGLPVIEATYEELKFRTVKKLKNNFALLQSEIESKQYLPIEKALFLFFLYDKDDAIEVFKKVIQKDIETRKFDFHEIEHFIHLDRFFERLGTSYIPKIENIQNSIRLSKEEDSISKNELIQLIDAKDSFNENTPLINLENHYFINIYRDAIPIKEIKEFFKDVLQKEFNVNCDYYFSNHKIDIVDVFFDNISNPHTKYNRETLIFTREILRDFLKKNNNYKGFLAVFRIVKELFLLNNSSKKIPKILSSYFGDDLKISIVNKYFNSNEENLDEEFLKIKEKLNEEYF